MTMTRTILFLSLFGTFSQAYAVPYVLSSSEIKKIIGDYPARGTQAEADDDAILLGLQASRSKAECAAAGLQTDESLRKFFGTALSNSEIRFLNVYLLKVKGIAAANATLAKKIYNRARPYNRNPEIKPCIELEGSSSYPSGHTTLARLYARVLSLRYPARAATFMKLADQAALNRVLGGVHHPSDIEAGKKLGDYLAKTFYK